MLLGLCIVQERIHPCAKFRNDPCFRPPTSLGARLPAMHLATFNYRSMFTRCFQQHEIRLQLNLNCATGAGRWRHDPARCARPSICSVRNMHSVMIGCFRRYKTRLQVRLNGVVYARRHCSSHAWGARPHLHACAACHWHCHRFQKSQEQPAF